MQKRDPRKKKYWCPLEFGARTWGAKSQRSPVFSAEGPRHLLGARAGGEKRSGSKARTHTHCRATEPAFWPPPLPDLTSPRDKRASPRAQLDPPTLGTPVGLPPLWGHGFVRGGPLSWPAGSSWKVPQCLPVAALGHLLFPVASSPPARCLLRFLSRTPRVPLARPPSPSSALAHGLVFLGW